MKIRAPAFVLLGITALIASPAFSQTTVGAPTNASLDARLNEQLWSQAGTYEWKRPDNVRFIILRACGGGGGGGGGFSMFGHGASSPKKETATGGGGGSGSVVSTILLGPLTAASYTVVVGRGGAGGASAHGTSRLKAGNGGQDGAASSFTGADLAFETPGAGGGRAAIRSVRMDVATNTAYEEFVTKAGSNADANSGGGSAQNGRRGLLGLGGAGSVSGDSGGGGGSLKDGGAGGDMSSSGSDGGLCAGGGGAGYLPKDGTSSVGGRGGDGSVMLLMMAESGPQGSRP